MVKKLHIKEDYNSDKVYKRVLYTINELNNLLTNININDINEINNAIEKFESASIAAKDIIKFDAGWTNKEYIDSFIYDVQIILDTYKAILDNIKELKNNIDAKDLINRADFLRGYNSI